MCVMLWGVWLAYGTERHGERGGVWSWVTRLRSAGQVEDASLCGAAQAGGWARARLKL